MPRFDFLFGVWVGFCFQNPKLWFGSIQPVLHCAEFWRRLCGIRNPHLGFCGWDADSQGGWCRCPWPGRLIFSIDVLSHHWWYVPASPWPHFPSVGGVEVLSDTIPPCQWCTGVVLVTLMAPLLAMTLVAVQALVNWFCYIYWIDSTVDFMLLSLVFMLLGWTVDFLLAHINILLNSTGSILSVDWSTCLHWTNHTMSSVSRTVIHLHDWLTLSASCSLFHISDCHQSAWLVDTIWHWTILALCSISLVASSE